MASAPLVVAFTADTSGLTAGMERATAIAQQSGAVMAGAYQGAGRAASQAADSVGRFAREQGQQARVVSRLTAELGSVIPMSRDASAATQAFGGALYEVAGGGLLTFGSALAVAGAAVAAYNILTADARAKIAALEQAERQMAQRVSASADDARRRIVLMHSTVPGGAKAAEEALKLATDIGEAKQAAAAAAIALDDANKKVSVIKSWAQTNPIVGAIAARFENLDEKAKAAARSLGEAKSNLEAIQRLEAEEDAARETRLRLLGNRGMGQGATAGLTPADIEAEKERAAKLAREARGRTKYDAAYRTRESNLSAGYGTDLPSEMSRQARERAELEANLTRYAGGPADRGMKGAMGSAGSPSAANEAIDAIAEQGKRIDALKAKYERFGDSAGRALGEAAKGHRDLGKTVIDVGRQALAMMVEQATKSILNSAFRGGAAAAADSAETGPQGLVAAPGVMAGFISMVAALAGSLVSARGGADFGRISAGTPIPMIGHGGEIMIPAPIASYVRKAAERDAENFGAGPATPVVVQLGGKTVAELLIAGGRGTARAQRKLAQRGAR